MKLVRFAGGTDTEDAKVLLAKLRSRYSDAETAWSVIGGFVPVAKRNDARYNFDVVWEELDEPV